jgi:hypothetical protein
MRITKKGIALALAALILIAAAVPLTVTNFTQVHIDQLPQGGTATPRLLVDNKNGPSVIAEFRDNKTPVARFPDGGGFNLLVGPFTNSGGQTNNDWFKISAPTAIATATPALVVDSLGVSNLVDIREAATPIASIRGWGAVTVTTTTTKHIWELVDTSPVMTAGTNIYSALNIDLAIGNSTAGTNNVYGVLVDNITGDAQVTESAFSIGGTGWDVGIDAGANTILNVGAAGTDFSATGGLTLADALTVTSGGASLTDGDMVVADDLRVTAQTSITVTNAAAFTPTGTYQNITAAGEVTPTITAGATAGDLLVLINTSAQVVNIADSGTAKLSAAAALNQFDVLVLWSDGTNWIEISRSDN